MTGPAQTPAHFTTAAEIAAHMAKVDARLAAIESAMRRDAAMAAMVAPYATKRRKYRNSLVRRLEAARMAEGGTQ